MIFKFSDILILLQIISFFFYPFLNKTQVKHYNNYSL